MGEHSGRVPCNHCDTCPGNMLDEPEQGDVRRENNRVHDGDPGGDDLNRGLREHLLQAGVPWECPECGKSAGWPHKHSVSIRQCDECLYAASQLVWVVRLKSRETQELKDMLLEFICARVVDLPDVSKRAQELLRRLDGAVQDKGDKKDP